MVGTTADEGPIVRPPGRRRSAARVPLVLMFVVFVGSIGSTANQNRVSDAVMVCISVGNGFAARWRDRSKWVEMALTAISRMVRYFGIIDTRHRVCGSMVVANPILPERRERPITLLPSSEEASEASLLANRRRVSGAKNTATSTSLFGCNRRAFGLVAATSSLETAAENAETEGSESEKAEDDGTNDNDNDIMCRAAGKQLQLPHFPPSSPHVRPCLKQLRSDGSQPPIRRREWSCVSRPRTQWPQNSELESGLARESHWQR